MMAADTLSSYGSMARFRDTNRLLKVGETTVIGASGEISDFQYVEHMFRELMLVQRTFNEIIWTLLDVFCRRWTGRRNFT